VIKFLSYTGSTGRIDWVSGSTMSSCRMRARGESEESSMRKIVGCLCLTARYKEYPAGSAPTRHGDSGRTASRRRQPTFFVVGEYNLGNAARLDKPHDQPPPAHHPHPPIFREWLWGSRPMPVRGRASIGARSGRLWHENTFRDGYGGNLQPLSLLLGRSLTC